MAKTKSPPKTKRKPPKKHNKAGTSKQSKAERVKVFVENYIINGNNATQAAIHAGYSEHTAGMAGGRLMKDDRVVSIIAARQAEIVKELGLNTTNVMRELSHIVKSDIRKLFNADGSLKPVDSWPDDVAGSVASVEIVELFDGNGKDRTHIGYTKKLKLWDKNSGITNAMKNLGLFEADHNQEKKSLHEFFDSCLGHGLKVKKSQTSVE